MYDIAIIGAGASGLAAAISAKRADNRLNVILIEALPRVGKKILATGNGRCNLTNLNATVKEYNSEFIASIMNQYPPEKIIEFFKSIGLLCVSDSEGRVYPISNTASSVLDCLRFEVERLGVDALCDTHVDKLIKSGNVFVINDQIKAKRVILATGGKASPSQGSDGSGYPLLKRLGHSITPLYPALVQLTVSENVKALKGIRLKAELTLKENGKKIDSSSGEILFTDYGLSGIAVMDISRSVKKGKYTCLMNILPSLQADEIIDFLIKRKKASPDLSLENILSGLVPKKAGQYILKMSGIHADMPINRLSVDKAKEIASFMKALSFEITGSNGFKNAQITSGGAVLSEFDKNTLESKKVAGLYCTGELLDVDAVCGGFNLQWAWASGIAAGKSAANTNK